MAQRSIWEDKYGYGIQTSTIDVPSSCTSGIFLMSHSQLDPRFQTIEQRKTTTSSSRSQLIEFSMNGRIPSSRLPIIMSPSQIYPFFRLFFQKGSLQDSSTNTIKWFYPYSFENGGSECEVWGTFVRELASTGTTQSQRITGSIVSSLSFLPSTLEYMVLDCSIIGRDFEKNRQTSGDTFTLSTDAPLLWRNCETRIGNSYDSLETFDLKRFGLTLVNNPVGRFYNNSKIKRFNLGNFVGNGRIIVPWENSSTNYKNNQLFTDYENGVVTRLSLYWNTQYATTGSSLSVNLLLRHNSVTISDDKEVSNLSEFILVEDTSFSYDNSKISSWTIDNSDDTKISFTFPGSQTLTGNVFPGDAVVTVDASSGYNNKWTIENVVNFSTVKLTSSHPAGTGAAGSNAIIIRQPINIGLNDNVNRGIT